MNVKKVFITAFCITAFLVQDAIAQKKRELEYSGFFDSYYFRGPVAITLGGGFVGYNGDLNKGFPSKSFKNVFSVGANYKVWPRTVFGAELSYFNLQANDSTPAINASFTSTNFELDLYGRFYLLDDIVRVAADRSRKPRRVKPYFTLGVGGVYYNPTTIFGVIAADSSIVVTDSANTPSGVLTRKAGTVAASGIALVIPVGFGVSYSFSHRVSLMGELTYKYALTDNLDGAALTSGLADSYYMFQLKLQLAPWAPKVKRKKKYKGQAPADNGGGGTESPNAPSEKPKAEETPENGAETPPAETPAQEVTPTDTPAQETPAQEKQEGDGWDQPQKSGDKPAGTK